MTKKYPSKIGWGILLPLVFIILTSTIFMAFSKAWLGLAINLIVAAFILHLFAHTYYVIQGTQLIVKSGFLFHARIDILSITKISETNNFISSPALSLDRLEIRYQPRSSVIISPKDKQGFLEHLLQINPNISIHYKNGEKVA